MLQCYFFLGGEYNINVTVTADITCLYSILTILYTSAKEIPTILPSTKLFDMERGRLLLGNLE